ncbi:hypothetical protein ACVIQY_002489 [Bradyrhizobium sp. USDA 3051]
MAIVSFICTALLQAVGASQEEAQAVITGCVNANLTSHDCHAVTAISAYIESLKMPGVHWTTAKESSTTAVAAYTVFWKPCGTARRVSLDSRKRGHDRPRGCRCRSPYYVAPFGGREARLGTNLVSIEYPFKSRGSVFCSIWRPRPGDGARREIPKAGSSMAREGPPRTRATTATCCCRSAEVKGTTHGARRDYRNALQVFTSPGFGREPPSSHYIVVASWPS